MRGQIISYLEMCRLEGVSLQRGMNYRLNGRHSVILMSLRPDAPYADRVEEDGLVLVYEGHNAARRRGEPNPALVDQPEYLPSGKPTENGKFANAARGYKEKKKDADLVECTRKFEMVFGVITDISD